MHLVAEYLDGTKTEGEAKIPNPRSRIKHLFLTDKDAVPTKDALDSIKEADIIILSPGSLYTSLIPNLIIKGMSEMIANSPAFKIYVCNVMTQHGETDSYTAYDHVKAIVEHANKKVIDACLVNIGEAPLTALSRYQHEHSYPVVPDVNKIREMGYKVVTADLLNITDYVRHDAKKLNQAIIKLIETNRIIKR